MEVLAEGLDEVVVTVSARKNTESAGLSFQKSASLLMVFLSENKSTGASDVASAESVPGVSVQGGKYVYVRGLGDRYTKSILNGIDICDQMKYSTNGYFPQIFLVTLSL